MLSQLKKLSREKKNLIFDFDKTIAQMEIDWSDWHQGVSKIYSKYDKSHGYRKGLDPHVYYNTLVDKHGDELVADIRIFVSKYEQEYNTGFTPYPELIEFITNNNSNDLFVFSSNSRSTVLSGLRDLEILDAFKQLITRDEVMKLKPDTEGFNLLKYFREKKDDYLMIGDSSSDELAAKTAGIDFLKCTYFGTYVFSE